MIEREAANGHYIPEFMPGGPDNPLGARALYIGDTEFRIHGTASHGRSAVPYRQAASDAERRGHRSL